MQGNVSRTGRRARSPALRAALVGTLSVAALVAMAGYALKLLVDAGTFDKVWAHHPAMTCKVHKGLPGVEDLVRVEGTSRVLATSQTRVLREGETFRSGFYEYDASRPDTPPRAILVRSSEGFAPHGVGYLAAPDSRPGAPKGWAHVVNHGTPGADTVELFTVDGANVEHTRTFRFPAVTTMNAVAALDESTFYFTTDFGSHSPLQQAFEKYLRIARGTIRFHKDGVTRTVASGLFFGNGVVRSPDGRRLYVAEMLARQVRVFDIVEGTGELREREPLFLDTAPDNLRFDDRGRLVVAAHPRLLSLNAHSKAPWESRSPSQVLAIEGPDSESPTVEELLADPGATLSAVSTALPFERNLLLGTIYDDGLVHCRLD